MNPWIDRQVKSLTWAQDAAGNPYISAAETTLDPGTAYELKRKTEQDVDVRGNLLAQRHYDW